MMPENLGKIWTQNLQEIELEAIKNGRFKITIGQITKNYSLNQLINAVQKLDKSNFSQNDQIEITKQMARIGILTKKIKYEGKLGAIKKLVDKILNFMDTNIKKFSTDASRTKEFLKDYAVLKTDSASFLSRIKTELNNLNENTLNKNKPPLDKCLTLFSALTKYNNELIKEVKTNLDALKTIDLGKIDLEKIEDLVSIGEQRAVIREYIKMIDAAKEFSKDLHHLIIDALYKYSLVDESLEKANILQDELNESLSKNERAYSTILFRHQEMDKILKDFQSGKGGTLDNTLSNLLTELKKTNLLNDLKTPEIIITNLNRLISSLMSFKL